MKRYLDTDVYTAAQKRIALLFSEFDNIYVSFSGGKAVWRIGRAVYDLRNMV